MNGINMRVALEKGISETMSMNITQADIQHLIHDPSVQIRENITQKICRGFNERDFSDSEKKLAIDIMRLLLKDTAKRIRKSLAVELCNNIDVPRDIALALANDHDDVSKPILKYSPALSEEDLVMLVESSYNAKKLSFIAQRDSVSAPLSHALIRHGNAAITKTVLNNKSASINDRSLDYVLEEFGNDQSVLETLVYRGGLPYHYAEQLFAMVSDHLKKDLTKRYRLARHVVDDATENARETAVMEFLSPWMSEADIQELVANMHRSKRLTDSVIIRALCAGNLRLFEAALAKRANISVVNARILATDSSAKGFSALYDAANMPDNFSEAIRVLFKMVQEETGFGSYHHECFAKRIVARIVQEGHAKTIENMSYLMSVIGWSTQDVSAVH